MAEYINIKWQSEAHTLVSFNEKRIIYRKRKGLYKLNQLQQIPVEELLNIFANCRTKKKTVHMFHRAKYYNPKLLKLMLNCTMRHIITKLIQKNDLLVKLIYKILLLHHFAFS